MEDEVYPMKNANIPNVKWGEIYYCDLGINKGSVQSGKRPVLVIQNNIGNKYGPRSKWSNLFGIFCAKNIF